MPWRSRIVIGLLGSTLSLLAMGSTVDSHGNSHPSPRLSEQLASHQHTEFFLLAQSAPSRLHYSAVYQEKDDNGRNESLPHNSVENPTEQSSHVDAEWATQNSRTRNGGAALSAILRNSLQQWWGNYRHSGPLHWLTDDKQADGKHELNTDATHWDYSLKLSDDKVGVKFEKQL